MPSFAGIHLTGVPAENLCHDKAKAFQDGVWTVNRAKVEELWTKLEASQELGYTLVANGRSTQEYENLKDKGILPMHTYGVLDLTQIEDESNNWVKLVKLNNS